MNSLSVLRRSISASFTRLACAAALAAAGTSTLADPGKTRTLELKIGVAIAETLSPGDSATCPLIGHVSGAGYATELGAVSVLATDCFAPTDTTGTAFAFFTRPGTLVKLKTASGDELHGTYQGTAVGNPYPIQAISGNVAFSGGTGRFKRASGSASIEGVENIGTTPAVGFLVISGQLTF